MCFAAQTRLRCGRVSPFSTECAPRRLRLVCRAETTQEAHADYKKAAASVFVDRFITDGQVLGLGSGELVYLTIREIAHRLALGRLKSVSGIPTCAAAASEAAFHGLPLTTSALNPKIDLAFDEADQLDVAKNAALKGIKSQPQQPDLVAAQQMARQAEQFVLLADEDNVLPKLQGPITVAIEAEDWEAPAEELDDIFVGDAELWRRSSDAVAHPRGGDNPYVSPDGHNLIDIIFEEPGMKLFGEDVEYEGILKEITSVEGVAAHGMMLGVAKAAVIARKGAGQPEVVEF